MKYLLIFKVIKGKHEGSSIEKEIECDPGELLSEISEAKKSIQYSEQGDYMMDLAVASLVQVVTLG